MVSSPHLSAHLLVGVGALVVTVGALRLTSAISGAPPDLRSWPRRLIGQVRADLEQGRKSRQWLVVLGWGALVTLLHFGGLYAGVYTRFFWWDILTHAMGGAGVAGILFLGLRDGQRTAEPSWWIVAAVAAVGAGFEVYEFLFKSFWYRWSLRFYVIDTGVDIVVNTLGAVVFVVVVGVWWRRESRASKRRQRL
jgi:hypothetical protein